MSSLITEEMHDVARADVEYFTEHGFQIKGIIHVGANIGQEIPWYLSKNYLPIIAFEPHPVAFKELRRIYGRVVMCMPFALGEKGGTLTLLMPKDGDTQRASKYVPIPTEGHDWTTFPLEGEVQVPMVRFDTWARHHDTVVDLRAYDTLVIDVQGMELEVLKGFGSCLKGFNFLVVECSDRPVYDGEASAMEVIKFLAKNGFIRLTEIEGHDDILFRRKLHWE